MNETRMNFGLKTETEICIFVEKHRTSAENWVRGSPWGPADIAVLVCLGGHRHAWPWRAASALSTDSSEKMGGVGGKGG